MRDLNGVDSRQVRVIELFAGIGGFRKASDDLGLKTVWANDNSLAACEVYRKSFGRIIEGDLEEHWRSVPSHDLLTAGFPCQPYSSAGKKAGRQDARSNVVTTMLKILRANGPAAFVLENVPFIQAIGQGEFFWELLKKLGELDYRVEWRVVNAADVGVPQFRPRILIVGSQTLGGDETDPVLKHFDGESHGEVSRRPSSRPPAWGALVNGSRVITYADRPRWLDWSHLNLREFLDDSVSERFDFTPETLERIKTSKYVGRVIRGVEVLYNQNGGSRMGYTVYGTSGLAPTFTATASRHYERFYVDGSYRRLTPQEYASIQGFDAEHCAGVTMAEKYKLVGNSVPPALAKFAIQRTLAKEGVEFAGLAAASA